MTAETAYSMCRQGDAIGLRQLLKQHPEFNVNSGCGYNKSENLLHIVIASGYVDCVNVLLKYGADANIESPLNRQNGLMVCVKYLTGPKQKNMYLVISALLSHKANINASDCFGRTALHYAAKKNYRDAVIFLLQCGANKDAEDNEGKRPIDLCSESLDVLFIANKSIKYLG